jgi:predicted DNA-binding transcriptional regulator AlpA
LEFEQSAAIVKTDKKHATQVELAEKAADLKAANAAKKRGQQPSWLQQARALPAPTQTIIETPERMRAADRSQGPPRLLYEVDRLLTVREVAEFLRCSKSSLDKWRLTGDGPRFVCVGSRVRYRASEVIAFIERQTRASTSEAPAA